MESISIDSQYFCTSKFLFILFILLIFSACSTSNPPESSSSPSQLVTASVVDDDDKTGIELRHEEAAVPIDGTVQSTSATAIFQPTVAEDINPAADIVEVNLEAKVSLVEFSSDVLSEVYTYNGTIPGPLIKTKKEDMLIVNFTNNLPEPTTIHWHGLQLPADMDGSSVAQNPIQPGASFRYQFKVNDPALFWYHPHVRSNEQVEKGLAGTLLVADEDDKANLRSIPEHILMLDDILLDNNGQVQPAFVGSIEDILLEKINGREGNVFLVNGQQRPTIQAEIGQPLRLRMVNIANTRFMDVSIPGHELIRIGGDGGLLRTAQTGLDHVTLVSGERADIIVTPQGEAGTLLPVHWNDVERGWHSITIDNGQVKMGHDPLDGKRASVVLFQIELIPSQSLPRELNLPSRLNEIKPIRTRNATVTTLKFGHSAPTATGEISFTINGKKFSELTSADAPDARIDETQIWDLVNMTGGDHPFHLHGFFFQVLETIKKDEAGNIIEVIPPPPLENKDMVNLPRRPGPKGSTTTVRIAIDFDHGERKSSDILANGGVPAIVNADVQAGVKGHSGGWLFHCHILEHADGGMMSFVEIWK